LIERELKASVGKGTHINNPRALSLSDQWPKLMSQIKVAQMVDSHVHLKVLLGKNAPWKQEDSSIVYKNINLLNMSIHSFHELIDCYYICQIQWDKDDLRLNLFSSYLSHKIL
jgi:hypothetical protein